VSASPRADDRPRPRTRTRRPPAAAVGTEAPTPAATKEPRSARAAKRPPDAPSANPETPSDSPS
jgi:hypothetical protein